MPVLCRSLREQSSVAETSDSSILTSIFFSSRLFCDWHVAPLIRKWAITHFGLCASLFPLCGVYEDFIEFSPSHQVGSLLAFVVTRVLKLFGRIFLTGRVSLFFALAVAGIAHGFTDDSNLKPRTAALCKCPRLCVFLLRTALTPLVDV